MNANRQDRTFGSGGGSSDMGSSTAHDQEWRTHYDDNFRSSGETFDRYQPAYQFGYSAAGDSRYTGRDWYAVEPDLRSDWEQSHPNDAWQDFIANWYEAPQGKDIALLLPLYHPDYRIHLNFFRF